MFWKYEYVAGVVGDPIGKTKSCMKRYWRENLAKSLCSRCGRLVSFVCKLDFFGSVITLIYILMYSFNNNYLSFKSIVPAKPPKPFYNPTCLVTKYCIFLPSRWQVLGLGPTSGSVSRQLWNMMLRKVEYNSHLVGRSSFRLPRFLRGRVGSVSSSYFSESWDGLRLESEADSARQPDWRGSPFSTAFLSSVGWRPSHDLFSCLSTSPFWDCKDDWSSTPLCCLATPTSWSTGP